ncbi:MAG TPA: hypothetical protein ENG51_00680 [Deltaproteobacteria bacterium]|nr:hypothetical protein [Deltaproteobacteria bacterium]HEC32004.1 hypothetical protein [Deltaproteobacteria bacterium]
MEPKEMMKQMIKLNKTAFENTFNSIIMLQNQTEQMVQTLVSQSPWLPDEGKKALEEWIKAYKKARDEFKKAVDESYKKVEDFFA